LDKKGNLSRNPRENIAVKVKVMNGKINTPSKEPLEMRINQLVTIKN